MWIRKPFRAPRLGLALLLLVPLCLGLPAGAEPAKRPPRIPSLKHKAKKEVEALFEKYFAAGESERPAILEEVAAFDPIPPSAVADFRKTLFKLAAKGRRTTGKNERTLDHPDYPGTFLIGGDSGRKEKGLFIGLHGGGEGAGDGATAQQKWQSAQGQNCICVFPTVIRKEGSAWNKEREERYVLELIETMKRTYRIDTNRIYLAGHSMGGYGTWSIGGHNADLFAAISPNAGGLFVTGRDPKTAGVAPGILGNLRNTPVYFTHGADDPRVSVFPDRKAAEILDELRKADPEGYEHVYKEYPNIGHGLPPDGTTPIIKWLVEHKRDPCPKRIVWEPVAAWKRTFFWLRVERVNRQEIVAVNHGGNSFEVTVKGDPGGLELLLNDDLIDFDEPVEVSLNGETVHDDFVHHSAAALLASIAERNDPKMYFTARLPLKR